MMINDDSAGDFEIRLDRWLKEVASDIPALPKAALELSCHTARHVRTYRNTVWEYQCQYDVIAEIESEQYSSDVFRRHP
jgi:hypothetical protein